MKPLSIIVPVFNGEKYIKRCISSVMKTEKIEYELIIINDCSTDKTEQIVKEIKDENIKLINLQQNKGVSYCRNLGVQEAKGRYITFLDVDDCIEKDMYSVMVQKAEEERVEVCCCNYYEINENTNKKVKSKYQLKNEVIEQPEIIKLFLTDKISPACWDKIYRSDFLKEKIKVDEELAVGEDILFILDVMKQCKKLAIVDSYFYYYIQQEQSVMHKISPKFLQFKKVVEKTQSNKYKNIRNEYKQEYEYFKGAMIVRGIHSISTLANKENRKQAKEYINQLLDKQTLKKWVKNPYVSKFIKIEIQILLAFGVNIHLLLTPIYKFMRGKLRK